MPPPNTAPVFSYVGDVQWAVAMVTANNTIDLTSGTSYLVWTADATNGGYLDEIRVKVNPANNSAATVVRFWINNGSTLGTATNSAIIGELQLPATTTSATAAQPDFSYAVKKAWPPGYRVYATLGTAPGGSCELSATAFGGKY